MKGTCENKLMRSAVLQIPFYTNSSIFAQHVAMEVPSGLVTKERLSQSKSTFVKEAILYKILYEGREIHEG